ncbi:hypothetical protein BJ322DRAFT_710730 [Thelephora terrestris]|uniref:Uncharacterized protein n=1 Tax=Thelephora terrestris TaxID=56493 RepID=A0A9P6HJF4_9AGAM|nr:hypothetical protein BJ322DRAFT_710730 [Thelephora terrestris]
MGNTVMAPTSSTITDAGRLRTRPKISFDGAACLHLPASVQRRLTLPIPGSIAESENTCRSQNVHGISLRKRELYISPLNSVDADGKLRWERTGQLVDTSAGHWKDAGHGRGIVREEHPDRPDLRPRTSFGSSGSPSSVSVTSDESEDSLETAVEHYTSDPQSSNWIQRAVKRNFTLKGLMNKLLKRTVKRNTWIYVSDQNFNLFVGIKDPGSDPHPIPPLRPLQNICRSFSLFLQRLERTGRRYAQGQVRQGRGCPLGSRTLEKGQEGRSLDDSER